MQSGKSFTKLLPMCGREYNVKEIAVVPARDSDLPGVVTVFVIWGDLHCALPCVSLADSGVGFGAHKWALWGVVNVHWKGCS